HDQRTSGITAASCARSTWLARYTRSAVAPSQARIEIAVFTRRRSSGRHRSAHAVAIVAVAAPGRSEARPLPAHDLREHGSVNQVSRHEGRHYRVMLAHERERVAHGVVVVPWTAMTERAAALVPDLRFLCLHEGGSAGADPHAEIDDLAVNEERLVDQADL